MSIFDRPKTYRVDTFQYRPEQFIPGFEDALNGIANEGWEVLQIIQKPAGEVLLFIVVSWKYK